MRARNEGRRSIRKEEEEKQERSGGGERRGKGHTPD